MLNFRRSSQAWKKRLKHWTYTCSFVSFLNIQSFIRYFIIFSFHLGCKNHYFQQWWFKNISSTHRNFSSKVILITVQSSSYDHSALSGSFVNKAAVFPLLHIAIAKQKCSELFLFSMYRNMYRTCQIAQELIQGHCPSVKGKKLITDFWTDSNASWSLTSGGSHMKEQYRTHGLISACAYLQNCKEICA